MHQNFSKEYIIGEQAKKSETLSGVKIENQVLLLASERSEQDTSKDYKIENRGFYVYMAYVCHFVL